MAQMSDGKEQGMITGVVSNYEQIKRDQGQSGDILGCGGFPSGTASTDGDLTRGPAASSAYDVTRGEQKQDRHGTSNLCGVCGTVVGAGQLQEHMDAHYAEQLASVF